MLKFLTLLLTLIPATTLAQEQVIAQGEFRTLHYGTRVVGEAAIIQTTDHDLVEISNFKISGGVVMDIKVCGDIDNFKDICLSLGNPRRSGDQHWRIPTRFTLYKKVVIFDLDLIYNLAEAPLH